MEKQSGVAAARQQIAELAGIDPAQISMSNIGMFDLLLAQGLAVRMSVHGTSMFEIECPDDLIGLSAGHDERYGKYRSAHIRAPRFDLSGKEVSGRISSLSRAARNYLARVKMSVGYELETGWIWIPYLEPAADGTLRGFDAVKARIMEYQREYNEYIAHVAAHRDAYLQHTLNTIGAVAKVLYKKINPRHRGDAPQAFIEKLTNFVVAKFPTAAQIASAGHFDVYIRGYALPSVINADKLEVQAQNARHRLLIENQRAYLDAERNHKEAQLDVVLRDIARQASGLIGDVVNNITRAVNRENIPNSTLKQARELANNLAPLFLLIGRDADLQELAERVSNAARRGTVNQNTAELETALAQLSTAVNSYIANFGVNDAADFVRFD